ncbi:MAG: hypothetical protein EHM32_08465 [Spirochaetales bacterium]|nr:MAG: hypothetical protein EHM32_08465 [Spirochaetales bacterium]
MFPVRPFPSPPLPQPNPSTAPGRSARSSRRDPFCFLRRSIYCRASCPARLPRPLSLFFYTRTPRRASARRRRSGFL